VLLPNPLTSNFAPINDLDARLAGAVATALPAHYLADLLRALRPWEHQVSQTLWQEIRTALAETRDPTLLPLKRLIVEDRP
jgi:hypothetical protein